MLNDVRNLLGGLFARMWGLSPSDLDRVFPGAVPLEFGRRLTGLVRFSGKALVIFD